jgi:hypothetical protein
MGIVADEGAGSYFTVIIDPSGREVWAS